MRSVTKRHINAWINGPGVHRQKTNAYIRLRSCVGKKAFASAALARAAVGIIGNSAADGLKAYQCRYCNLFHLGH